MDEAVLVVMANEFAKSYNGQMVAWNQDAAKAKDSSPKVHLLDVRHYLRSNLEGAYRLLTTDKNILTVRSTIDGGLAARIEEASTNEIATLRKTFFKQLEPAEQSFTINPVMRSFSWPMMVEMAMLNEQLNREVHNLALTKGDCGCHPTRRHAYYLPMPKSHEQEIADHEFLAAAEQFRNYVSCRWPIHVFHVDPVNEDQNVSDSSVLGRELAIAVAVGVAAGKVNIRQASQFVRQYREQIDTIGLNRTVSGFSHGSDTFGWTFRPRVQTLPSRGTAVAFGETLFGRGPEASRRDAALEPGMRECTAIVLMPSFVPYCDFEVATSWFRLDNPRSKEISNHQTMKLSRSIKYMEECSIRCAANAHLYRDGDVERLLNRVKQLEKELPLQSMRVQIPYENTLGGFELFNNGVTDLAPELVGWYGGRGIVVGEDDATTEVFLVGENLSVHDTNVVAGGKAIDSKYVKLISRHVMQITVPSSVKTVNLKDELSNAVDHSYVSVYAATPYGVTSHLHIPALKVEKEKTVNEEVTELTKRVVALEEANKKSPFEWDKPPTLPVLASFIESGEQGKYDRCCFEIGSIDPTSKYTLKWKPQVDLPQSPDLGLNQLKGGLVGRLFLAGKPAGDSFWLKQPGEFDLTENKKLELTADELFKFATTAIRSNLSTARTGFGDVTNVELRTWIVPFLVLGTTQTTDTGTIANSTVTTTQGDPVQTDEDIKIQVIQKYDPAKPDQVYDVQPASPAYSLTPTPAAPLMAPATAAK